MANVESIFGGAFTPPAEESRIVESPESQFRNAMIEYGIEPPDQIIIDGSLHRFKSGSGKAFDRSGWYVAYPDGVPTMTFGDWRQGIEQTIRADVGRKPTIAEEMESIARIKRAKELRDSEREKRNEITASTVETIWDGGTPATTDHPYLKKKGIEPHGAKVTGDGRLMVPLYGIDGKLATLQYIDTDGGKLYHPGGATGGKFAMIGTVADNGTIYIAEGFATAATIHEVTGRPCIVAYSASNLVPVTGIMRDKYGIAQDLVIVADNDASGVGQRYADQSCAKYGARYVMPETKGDANDYHLSGNNLKLLLEPPKIAGDWLISADSFCEQPSPIRWLVKHWLQEQALIMVHGPSGGGKTFVVLDWCMRMASGMSEWMGHKVKQGNVIYLAGEGHHGLRSRVAGWKHYHQKQGLSMWLSSSGCDLNTAEGYQRVLENIKALGNQPSLIVVDTLHRFLHGDENSAQDAKTMLDACNALMTEFTCSVLLVHHTGVSDDNQHRARGSSAWKGALDIEISIVPAKGDNPIQIIQRKSKDSELSQDLFGSLESVEIPGWIDEDGEPVKSAVLIKDNAPVKTNKKDSKLTSHIKLFTNAWFNSGAELNDGLPYVSRSSMINYLVTNMGCSEATAKTYIKPSQSGRLIYELLNSEIISPHEHGWIVTDDVNSSAMLLREQGNRTEQKGTFVPVTKASK